MLHHRTLPKARPVPDEASFCHHPMSRPNSLRQRLSQTDLAGVGDVQCADMDHCDLRDRRLWGRGRGYDGPGRFRDSGVRRPDPMSRRVGRAAVASQKRFWLVMRMMGRDQSGWPVRQRYSRKVPQQAWTRADRRGRGRTVTCAYTRGWTGCRLPLDGMQEVWGSNPHSSTAQRYNSKS